MRVGRLSDQVSPRNPPDGDAFRQRAAEVVWPCVDAPTPLAPASRQPINACRSGSRVAPPSPAARDLKILRGLIQLAT